MALPLASSRTNSSTSQVVQKAISAASSRLGGPSAPTSARSCQTRKPNTTLYMAALPIMGRIVLVALMATPFTVWWDALTRDATWAHAQMISPAIKLVMVGISHWLVNSFMGGPLLAGGGVESPPFSSAVACPPNHPVALANAAQGATESVANHQGA